MIWLMFARSIMANAYHKRRVSRNNPVMHQLKSRASPQRFSHAVAGQLCLLALPILCELNDTIG